MATQVSLNSGAVASAGALALQTNGTTEAVSISTGQVATLAQNPILTSGTANGVAYLNGSKAVTSGSALTFDGTNFATTGTASATKMIPTGGSATGNGMYLPASNTLAWSNNGSETMRLDSAGNLGLGVTPSAWGSGKALEISISGSSIWGTGSINDIRVLSNAYFNGTNYKYGATGYANMYIAGANAGQHQWYNAASGTAGSAITFTQAMTLDASGNLGVGTTSPAAKLELSGSGNNILSVTSSSNGEGTLYLGCQGTGAKGNIVGRDYLTFHTTSSSTPVATGTERARIDSSGNLLVGTTSTSVSSTGFRVIPADAGAGNPAAYISHSGTTNASGTGYQQYSTGASAYRFYVGYGGTIYATSTTITAISDQRLKENIRDLDEGLNVVMALKPRKFDWKEGKGKDIKNDRGWIAQEFEIVLPDMIDEWKDPAPEGEEPYKSVNANLIPTLVKAIQEQQALITQLQADVAALKGA